MRFLPRRRLLRRLDAEQTSGSGDLRALLVDLGRELGGGARVYHLAGRRQPLNNERFCRHLADLGPGSLTSPGQVG